MMRTSDAVAVDSGGTGGKLETPVSAEDQWPYGPPRLNVPTRELAVGDVLLVNDYRVVVRGRAKALPRYPPKPLMYTTLSNAARLLPPKRHLLTFVVAQAAPGVSPQELASRVEVQTGLKSRSSEDFKRDTVDWLLRNSEDVGDIASMMSIAMLVGFGVMGVMLYLFTTDSLKQYAVLKAMGADSRLLLTMIFVQSGLCALLGLALDSGCARWLVRSRLRSSTFRSE
jgi:putative ABC transport system permease protein